MTVPGLLILGVVLSLHCGCGKPETTRGAARRTSPAKHDQREQGRRPRPPAHLSSRPISEWPFQTRLPLVCIDTGGARIPDEPKIPARIRLIHQVEGRNDLGSPVQFEGAMQIEVRGKTSQQFPKKQFGLKLEQGVSLLEMPPAKEWILHGPYSDKTLMRNFLAYELSNRLGNYAPRTRFVELLLNDRGDMNVQPAHYAGVYLLMERIERGPDRVRIGYDTLADAPESDPVFLMKIDKMDNSDRTFATRRGTRIIHVYPKGDPSDERARAARAYMEEFESALADAGDQEESYQRFVDLGSFVDYLLLNELFKNIDAYRLSTYFHKDRGGKLRMGPVWDFNLSLGNADYYDGAQTRGWLVDNVPAGEGYPIPFWWGRLMRLRVFREALRARWHVWRADVLADAQLLSTIDGTAALLEEAQRRNFEKWPVLGGMCGPIHLPSCRPTRGWWINSRIGLSSGPPGWIASFARGAGGPVVSVN